jgi:hypothetical protein
MTRKNWVLVVAVAVGLALAIAACGGGGSTAPITTVKTPDGKVSFAGTVQPILQDHCKRCHDVGGKSSLYLMTYDGIMKGGKMGQVVLPGDPDGSQIIGSVEKTKTPNMPPKIFPALTKDRVDALRTWIKEGAENN